MKGFRISIQHLSKIVELKMLSAFGHLVELYRMMLLKILFWRYQVRAATLNSFRQLVADRPINKLIQ